jgi:hypothetical protein
MKVKRSWMSFRTTSAAKIRFDYLDSLVHLSPFGFLVLTNVLVVRFPPGFENFVVSRSFIRILVTFVTRDFLPLTTTLRVLLTILAVVLFSLLCIGESHHRYVLRLGSFHPVLGTALVALLLVRLRRSDSRAAILGATDDVVTNTWEILYSPTTDEDSGVFLEIVLLSRNVRCDLDARGETHTADDALGRVRLLRRHDPHARDGAGFHRSALERRSLATGLLKFSSTTYELVNRAHSSDTLPLFRAK